MADESSSSIGCGCMPVGGATILGIVFVTLKLLGKIDWSWVWVTCPFWAGYAFLALVTALFFGGFAALLGVVGLADYFSNRRR